MPPPSRRPSPPAASTAESAGRLPPLLAEVAASCGGSTGESPGWCWSPPFASGLAGDRRPRKAAIGARAAAPAVPVAVARVTRKDLYNEVTIPAEFRPYVEVELHAKVSGYVREMNVDFGDRVKAGQLLATLEVRNCRTNCTTPSRPSRRPRRTSPMRSRSTCGLRRWTKSIPTWWRSRTSTPPSQGPHHRGGHRRHQSRGGKYLDAGGLHSHHRSV